MSNDRNHRIPHLDGLRGIAALAVVLCHYTLSMESASGVQRLMGRIAHAGWLGVDVFFTLSGFLITGILLDERGKERCFSTFYLRRAFRLLPLYYGYVLVIHLGVNAVHWWRGFGPYLGAGSLLAHLTYTQNLYSAAQEIFLKQGLGHLWSLGIEEQFYLIWPAIVFSQTSRRVSQIAGSLLICSLVARLGLVLCGCAIFSYQFTLTHIDGICMGALGALLVRGSDPFKVAKLGPKIEALCWASLIITGLAGGSSSSPWLLGVGPVLIACITVRAILSPGKWARNVLSLSPLRWVGRYSYAVYVLQVFPGFLAQRWLFSHSTNFCVRAAGVIALIAILLMEARLSWAILEGPMLRLRDRLERKLSSRNSGISTPAARTVLTQSASLAMPECPAAVVATGMSKVTLTRL